MLHCSGQSEFSYKILNGLELKNIKLCIHMCTHVYVCVVLCFVACACVHWVCVCVCVRMCVCVHVHVCVYFVYVYVLVCVCMHDCLLLYVLFTEVETYYLNNNQFLQRIQNSSCLHREWLVCQLCSNLLHNSIIFMHRKHNQQEMLIRRNLIFEHLVPHLSLVRDLHQQLVHSFILLCYH